MAFGVNSFSKTVKFSIFEGYSVIPLLIWAPRPNFVTFGIFLTLIIVLTLMARRGMRGAMIWRRLRRLAVGGQPEIRPHYRCRE
jgi:hypothetical protein